MADPNLEALTITNIATERLAVTTSFQDIVAAPATGSPDHAKVVEAVMVCNFSSTTACWVTLIHKVSGVDFELVHEESFAAKTSDNILPGSKPFFLKAGESLQIKAQASSNVYAFAPRSDIV